MNWRDEPLMVGVVIRLVMPEAFAALPVAVSSAAIHLGRF